MCLYFYSTCPDNIPEAGRLWLPYGTCGSLRQSTAAVHSVAGRRRLCQIKNAHATAWWREADAGWLLACRCQSGAGNTGSAGLNATGGVTTGCQRRPTSGCADVDRDRDDRLRRRARAPGWRHNWNCRPGLSEWRKVTCSEFFGFSHQVW